MRHKVEAVKVQVDAKAGEKQVAEKLVQDAQAKVSAQHRWSVLTGFRGLGIGV